ncbi:sulfatase-like hydrolase/transferase [Hymenobacter sp. BT683]|uniref:Sulfatase-like hydrolase/transferase n=1 Tax=Hymenobacter jeongseonensis TaxID=2791027 RepID=A0ABS0IKK7_9BACT|nr:sulfatase-like hydrolase/transferase [Hymenobacter jeongseonensis]MBF9238914.1 sulfatase-like hydrolase/transferase [Hymenobacter jeongseonensis]
MLSVTLRKLGCITLSLMVVLFLIRPQVLAIPYHIVFGYFRGFYIILLASYYDLLLATALGLVFMTAAWLVQHRPRAQSFLVGAFVGVALFCVLIGHSYVITSSIMGGPMTYGWLYYSDFMQNSDFDAAMRANLSWTWFGQLLGWSALLLLSSYALWALVQRVDAQNRYFRPVLAVLCGNLLVYFVVAPRSVARNDLTYKTVANPVLAFSKSVYVAFVSSPDLFTMQVPMGFESFPMPAVSQVIATKAPVNSRIRNVVLVVLESVPAEYVPGYQTRINAMPHLARQVPHALRVTDMYAHMPSTNNAVVALLGSLYPRISYESISKENPAIRVPSLSSELKRRHYRTGFFFAADTRFQNIKGFLAHRKFDVVADYRTIVCTGPVRKVNPKENDFLDSANEECLVQAGLDWLPADTTGAPFFVTLWTAQTHYPYFPPPGKQKNFRVQERYLNRYLNALHHTDKQLGKLFNELNRRRLAESTLVVVVGDHGEAFGRHMQYGHAGNVYEENVRIPLLLINPLLFRGETLDAVGGQVDIAPSIFDVLGLPIPKAWQGASLFSPTRVNRAYFFSPYSQYTFGIRTPEYKIVFNAYTSKTQIFDIKKDPRETTDLAAQMPQLVEESQQRLAAWVQYQNAYLEQVLKSEPKTLPVINHAK